MYYDTPYPFAKGVRDYSAQHVIRAIHIGVQTASIAGPEQPACGTPTGIDLMLADRLRIEEAALAGVTLLGQDDLDADQFCLVGQHLNEARMWKEDEVLIRAFA